jgi:GntR family negative regulator for fad regulon and positive regulator of fabA
MDTPSPRHKPVEHAVHTLLRAILDGSLAPGARLTNERRLAGDLGVTRPTLREALHRLALQGWLSIHHGKPTKVNDIWQDGGLGVLASLAMHRQFLPPGFPGYLLEMRCYLFPPMAAAAARRSSAVLGALLQSAPGPAAEIEKLVAFDWELHRCMARESGNPVYAWILNDFGPVFAFFAREYFRRTEAAAASRRYYRRLARALVKGPEIVEREVRNAMEESLTHWRRGVADP